MRCLSASSLISLLRFHAAAASIALTVVSDTIKLSSAQRSSRKGARCGGRSSPRRPHRCACGSGRSRSGRTGNGAGRTSRRRSTACRGSSPRRAQGSRLPGCTCASAGDSPPSAAQASQACRYGSRAVRTHARSMTSLSSPREAPARGSCL